MKGASKALMPMCDYGKACKRKDCIYRHPPKEKKKPSASATTAAAATSSSSSSSSSYNEDSNVDPENICVPYLQGQCAFGVNCRNYHVKDPEYKKNLLAKFASTKCRYGVNCQTKNCLFFHDQTPIHVTALLTGVDPNKAKVFVPGKGLMTATQASGNITTVEPDVDDSVKDEISDPSVKKVIASSSNVVSFPLAPQAAAAMATKTSAKSANDYSDIPRVAIPQELWTPSWERQADLYKIDDPWERFLAVNKNSHESIYDLHFQTAESSRIVLDRLFRIKSLKGSIWIITGSGHHTAQKGRRLFDIVLDYLKDNDKEFKIGKDSNGHESAFRVYL